MAPVREGGIGLWFVQTVCGCLNRNLLIPRRLIFESSIRAGMPSFSAAPPGPETRPGSPQEPTGSFPFPAGLTPHSVRDLRILELGRFQREPAIIHQKRVVLAQDYSPFNDILKLSDIAGPTLRRHCRRLSFSLAHVSPAAPSALQSPACARPAASQAHRASVSAASPVCSRAPPPSHS